MDTDVCKTSLPFFTLTGLLKKGQILICKLCKCVWTLSITESWWIVGVKWAYVRVLISTMIKIYKAERGVRVSLCAQSFIHVVPGGQKGLWPGINYLHFGHDVHLGFRPWKTNKMSNHSSSLKSVTAWPLDWWLFYRKLQLCHMFTLITSFKQ